MSGLLENLDHAIEALMPADKALERRRAIDAADRREHERVRAVVKECAVAIECLASAIQYPRIGVGDIEQAIEHARKALEAATELDK